MINKKLFNFSFNEIFLIFSYLVCWFSISTSYYDVLDFVEKKKFKFYCNNKFFKTIFKSNNISYINNIFFEKIKKYRV